MSKEEYNSGWEDDVCVACGQTKTPEGHDPCIANLPGVLYACCGHGKTDGYIKFEDGRCLRFYAKEVDIDLPTVKYDGVPCFQLGGCRIFDFNEKRVKIKRYSTNIINRRKK